MTLQRRRESRCAAGRSDAKYFLHGEKAIDQL